MNAETLTITEIVKGGLVINEAGIYSFSDDIQTDVIENSSEQVFTAIKVTCNDVIIEGHQYCLTQQKSQSKRQHYGIVVEENCRNVTIRNLTICNFNTAALVVKASTVNIKLEGLKIRNCGYGLPLKWVAQLRFPQCPDAFSHGILIEAASQQLQIKDCDFIECGLSMAVNDSEEPRQYALSCSALTILADQGSTLQGCTIDGCVGLIRAYGLTAIKSTQLQVKDLFITDIFSTRDAQYIYHYDIDAEFKQFQRGALLSNIPMPVDFPAILKTHGEKPPKLAISRLNIIELQVNHIQNVVPLHREKEELLVTEHKWRDFRTLLRQVCHNSPEKSKTSAIYAKWCELFCEKILGVKIRVERGFANLYRDGTVALPIHRDAYNKWIIGLSFGESRTMDFVPDDPSGTIQSYVMETGDVLLFSHEINKTFQHRMLSEPHRSGRRVNLTYFFEVLPGQVENHLLRPINRDIAVPSFEEAEIAYGK